MSSLSYSYSPLTSSFLYQLFTDIYQLFLFSYRPLLLSEDEEDTKRVVRSAKDKRYV